MSEETRTRIAANLNALRERIRSACDRCGRSPDEVTLVAVTKYAEIDWVRELVELGVNELGEARPQQLASRAKELPSKIHWHLIGHLQRNKADAVLPITSLIHSVDSVRLFDHLAKLATATNSRPRVLLEVNVSGESSKDGFRPDEVLAAWPQLRTCTSLQIDGLMTMAALDSQPEAARPTFQALRELRHRLKAESAGQCELAQMSMGMSGDFEVAIEEGATIIRIGSSLFEGL